MKSYYDIIKQPLVTEKVTKEMEKHQTYTFEVHNAATKPQIKQAIEHIFPVKVARVRTMIMKGKPRKYRMMLSHQSNWKKAVINLKEGHRIDIV